MHSGRNAILLILGIGVVAAAFSVWYQQHQSRRALQFWGPENARLIARAPTAEALRLEAVDEGIANKGKNRLEISAGALRIKEQRDVSQAPGFGNVRRGLIQDDTFDWNKDPLDQPVDWEFGLRFEDEGQETVILLDLALGVASLASVERPVALDPAAVADLQAFFAEQLH